MQRILSAALALALVYQPAIADETEDAQRVCSVIESMGANIECRINAVESAADVTAGENPTDADQLCTSMSGMAAMLTTTLTRKWIMRIFTPDSGDAPAAVCDLN